MRRLGHELRRKSAFGLLAVFVAGGLMAPALHRIHHGVAEAQRQAEAPEACDHAQHGDGFEAAFPDFLDEDCLLCVRQVLHRHTLALELTAYHDASAFAAQDPSVVGHSLSRSLPIRGPPHAS